MVVWLILVFSKNTEIITVLHETDFKVDDGIKKSPWNRSAQGAVILSVINHVILQMNLSSG